MDGMDVAWTVAWTAILYKPLRYWVFQGGMDGMDEKAKLLL